MFAVIYKQSPFFEAGLKRPVFFNIGRFVFQRFKNIQAIDLCFVFIFIEMVILPSGKTPNNGIEKISRFI